MAGWEEKCYPAAKSTSRAYAGYALMLAGIILLFVCIPLWAWLALLGVVLMALGLLVLKWSNAWR